MARPIRRNYDIAGAFVMLSGLLHLPLVVLEGWNAQTKFFLIMGLIWIGMGLWLRGRHRWLAYIAYILVLIGAVINFAAMGNTSIGSWWWLLILIMDFLAIFHLFKILWANNPAKAKPVPDAEPVTADE